MRGVSAILIAVGAAGTAHAAPKPKLSLGTPIVTGALNARAVTAVVKRSSTRLLTCFKKALPTSPDLGGDMITTFTIDTDGNVANAGANGLIEPVATCVTETLSKLTFAKRKDGETTEVTFPLTFDSGVVRPLNSDTSSAFDDNNIYGGLLGNEAGDLVGGSGVGRSGPGPGGGGTGAGTIATGRHGTTASTGNGMRSGTAPRPTLSIGPSTVTGSKLDKVIVRRYLKRNIQKLVYCYELQLVANPKLAGTTTARFTIAADGKVSASAASGFKEEVDTCIADMIGEFEFPKPKDGAALEVLYPMTFKPAP